MLDFGFGSYFGCLLGLGEILLLGVQWDALSAVEQTPGLPKQILAKKSVFSVNFDRANRMEVVAVCINL